LIQKVVHAKYKFWGDDYRWICSIHDLGFFQKTNLKNCMMKDEFLPYKLIRDVSYPMHAWFYFPSKGGKDGLPRYKPH
jgi:hypothetical protein